MDGQVELSRPRWKQTSLDLAEVVDSLRIFPRLLVTAYGALVGYTTVFLLWWYCHLPSAERTVEVTAFFGMLMGGIFGLAAYVFKIYSDGGRDWDKYRADTFNQSLSYRRDTGSDPGPADVGSHPRTSG